MQEETPSIVIVGSGISGLSAAYRLQCQLPTASITVLDEGSRVGGKIATESLDGFRVETGPNGFLDSKPSTMTLCRDLGLKASLLEASAASGNNRYLFLDNRLQRLPSGLVSFISSPLLSWRGKINLLLERFRKRSLAGQQDESIAAFAERRVSREVAEVFADAMVTGIYAGDPALLSLPACFPRIATLEREHGSVIRGMGLAAKQRRREARARGEPDRRPGKMWSFREGLQRIPDALATSFTGEIITGVSARRLEKTGNPARPHWQILGEGQQRWQADAVVLACPAYAQAPLLADVDAALSDTVGQIPYNRIAVVALGFRQQDVPIPVDGFGFIAPQSTRRDILGVQWCSSIFPGRAPTGAVLLRALCGGWHRPEIVDWDDARLVNAVRADLKPSMRIEAAPIFTRIIRWDRAIPQYHVGHLARVATVEQGQMRHPGLFLAGNAYRGVAINDCTEQATLLAEQIARYLGTNGDHG